MEGTGLAVKRFMSARLALCGLCLALLHGSTHAATNVTRGNVQTYSFGYFGAHILTGCESCKAHLAMLDRAAVARSGAAAGDAQTCSRPQRRLQSARQSTCWSRPQATPMKS